MQELSAMNSQNNQTEIVGQIIQRLERVTAERDAAVADIKRIIWLTGMCQFCAHCTGNRHRDLDGPCDICPGCEPEWRGLKEWRKTHE